MDIETTLKNLPGKPGVYLMKNSEGQIIYVGKAINLKNRVSSYFRNQHKDSAKTRALVKNIADLEYILVDNEIEALILECNLIKKHRPKYNINLKDDKTYPYLKITKEDYPRLLITRKVVKDGARYFGPYPSANSLKDTVELLRKVFPYRSCAQKVFTNERPCLNAHINKCKAPCIGRISKEDYNAMIQQIVDFLEGKEDFLIKKLKQEMNGAAENLEFEKAAAIRDQLVGLEQIIENQKIVSNRDTDQDVIAMARGIGQACVQVFFVRGGKIVGRENYFLNGTDESERGEILGSFLQQFYMGHQFIPQNILVETEVPDQEVLEQWLSEKREGRVYLKVPKRGQQKELIELVGKNALDALTKAELEFKRNKERTEDAVTDLQHFLGLKNPPRRIECYDISNTQGTESVASMVVFVDGKAKKDQYRKFKIKTVEGPNDFLSMYEVITRRFENANLELANPNADSKKDKFSWLPDLVIIDGGKGQLQFARKAMAEQGHSDIPTYGLAKREELLFTEGEKEPIELPRDSNALYMIQRLRDEAHRFAITYHRSLRGKRNLASILDDIPGVGTTRRKKLLQHFGSFSKIQLASVDELMEVDSINSKVAEEIYHYLRSHQDLVARTERSKERREGE